MQNSYTDLTTFARKHFWPKTYFR